MNNNYIRWFLGDVEQDFSKPHKEKLFPEDDFNSFKKTKTCKPTGKKNGNAFGIFPNITKFKG